jgi:hypothetical protein
MTVISASTLTIKPDRDEDFVTLNKKTKAIMEKCGAKNVRLMAALVAGEASGSAVFTHEADDFGASGAVLDKFLADPEGLALLTGSTGETSPTASFQASQWIEIPI